MMDPLSAFSLACAVLQVVDFSCKLISTINSLYKKGSLEKNDDLERQYSHLSGLRSALSSDLATGRDSHPGHQELLQLATGCDATVQELLEQLDALKVSGSHRLWKSFDKSFTIMRRKGVIDRLNKKLDSFREVLDTRILITLRVELSDLSLAQNESFKKQDQRLQALAYSFTKDKISVNHLARLVSNESSSIRHHINQTLKRQEEIESEEKFHRSFLQSLHFPEIYCRQEQIKDAHRETFKWIFDKSGKKLRPWSNFVDWLEKGSGTYWIHGKAGCGKSTLMNYILDKSETMETLEQWAGGRKLLILSIFFWASGTPLQKSIQGFLRSLIFQILDRQPELISIATQQSKNFVGPEMDCAITWTEKRLLKCLRALAYGASSLNYRICLFIDGLDEFNGDTYDLIELIQELVQISNIKCCFSSRPERIFDDFATNNTLRLQDLTRSDIQKFVESKLSQFPQVKNMSPEQAKAKEELMDIIVRKADGVFLWVELTVKSQIIGMKNEDSVDTLRERLFSLPTEIEGLYSRMLAKIEPVYLKEAASFFQTARLLQTPIHLSFFNDHSHIFNFTVVSAGLTDTLQLSNDLSPSDISSKCSNVNHRILVTCAGFLEVFDDDENEDYPTHYERWLSWEPESFRSSYTGIDWSLRKVQFCHRTAKDFFELDHEGCSFLKRHTTLPANQSLLKAAIYLARMTLCNIADFDGYLEHQIHQVMVYASRNNPQTPEDLTLSINLLNYFDRAIESLDRRYRGTTSTLQWRRRWTIKSCLRDWDGLYGEGYAAALQFSENLALDDFLDVATYFSIYWYTQDALTRYQSDIDAYRATRLAIYTVAHPLHTMSSTSLSHVSTWDEIDVLTRLMRLGADPNVGFFNSIWEDVLRFMYRAKLSIESGSCDDNRLISVMETFQEVGAYPCSTISLLGHGVDCFQGTGLRRFEIDVSQLPLIPDIVPFEDNPCKEQEASKSDRSMSSNKSPRVWFEKSKYAGMARFLEYMEYLDEEDLRNDQSMDDDDDDDDADGDEKPWFSDIDIPCKEEHVMSDAEVHELYSILRIVLDAPSSEKKMVGKRPWLWVMHMRRRSCLEDNKRGWGRFVKTLMKIKKKEEKEKKEKAMETNLEDI